MRRKTIIFLVLSLLTATGLRAERYVDLAAQFSIDLPDGWDVTKQGDIYVFRSESDVMTMSVLQAERGETFSPNDASRNLKKGDEGMEHIKVHRGWWMTFYKHYVTRTYEQNGQQIDEYYRIFPKTAYCFRTVHDEHSDAKLVIARSARPEPWDCWTQFKIMSLKLGLVLTLAFLLGWIAACWIAAFSTPMFRESPAFVILLILLWLAIPLLWWEGEQIMVAMYSIAALVFIPFFIYYLRHPGNSSNGGSPNRELLLMIANIDMNQPVNNYAASELVAMAKNYREGTNGFKKSKKEAFAHILGAARLGNVDAMIEVSILYRDGEGVRRNRNEACEWMINAAKRGSLPAVTWLASFAYFGYGRFKASNEDAIWILQWASYLGNPAAKGILAKTTETVDDPQTGKKVVRFKKMDDLSYYFMTEKEAKRDRFFGKAIEFVFDKADDLLKWI